MAYGLTLTEPGLGHLLGFQPQRGPPKLRWALGAGRGAGTIQSRPLLCSRFMLARRLLRAGERRVVPGGVQRQTRGTSLYRLNSRCLFYDDLHMKRER